jgi:hypothetical protein
MAVPDLSGNMSGIPQLWRFFPAQGCVAPSVVSRSRRDRPARTGRGDVGFFAPRHRLALVDASGVQDVDFCPKVIFARMQLMDPSKSCAV